MTPLQQRLVNEVRAHGVSQAELARRTGLSQKHISQMMTGRAEGTLSAWQALMDAAQAVVDMCACGCGCEPDGDWHWSQQPWCRCVANGCPCVTDSVGNPTLAE